MTETRTAYTEHGEIEYEVVECVSCGQEVAKEDAGTMIISDGKIRNKHNWSHNNYVDLELYGDVDIGPICKHCQDTDNATPMSYTASETVGGVARRIASLVVGIMFGPYNLLKEEISKQTSDEAFADVLSFTITLVFWMFIVLTVLALL